jgi:hypothetical protein
MSAYTSHWYPSETSSFPISGELSTEAAPPPAPPQRKGRKSERVPVELGAGLRQRGASGVTVQIMDLSTDGFRVATHLELFAGTQVWLRLPGLEACHARVVWAEGHFIGCAFERPLHPAVLQMIIDKASQR